MIRLKVPLIPNENILNNLFDKNIFTVNDFLQKQSSDLQNICKLQCKEITKLKDILTIKCSSSINGYELYLNRSIPNFVQTGIHKLDNLLGGGLMSSNIYEFCGPSSCGKTQLNYSILLNIIMNTKRDIIYIDSRKKFSVNRIKQILKNKYHLTNQDIYGILKKLFVYSVSDIYCCITCLHSLKNKTEPIIFIDSLPAIYLSFVGFLKNDGLCYLNHICSVLKYLCKRNAIIVVTNLAVKNCSPITNNVNEEVHYNQCTNQLDFKPAIGKYWFHVPNTRLMFTTILKNKQQICIHISKSAYLSLNENCILQIDDCGVS
ncbi:DNA repair protein RAD51 homolog 4 [Sipha flava]|uniref:DNA repair protein RAD51 4 n=1 Tax=Sipha flava TaxID=143950 RepID=A0A2S2PX68_9HEMI|nr:DNA repair protein RAD51 homolog 4 [Sipha flava]XP_025417918.1 DNA repair protein RAD51 homolog 4 [Sipha flava]